MTFFYVLILVVTCGIVLGYSGYMHYDRQLKSEAGLLSAAAAETGSAVEIYMNKLSDAAVVLISGEEWKELDPEFSTADEFERAVQNERLDDRITELGLMDNYCDFAVVYSDGTCAGKLSEGSRDLLTKDGTDLYEAVSGIYEQNGGYAGAVSGDYRRIFYICQASRSAYFIGSFYAAELSNMIIPSHNVEDLRFYLTDGLGRIVFSNDTDWSIKLPKDKADSYVHIEHEQLTAGERLDSGWRLVMIKDLSETAALYRRYAIETAAVILAALIVLIVFNVMNTRAEGIYPANMTVSPSIDALTGLNNAEDAENLIADRLETCIQGSTIMIALVSIINLHEIEKKYDRSAYNGSIIKTYRAMAEYFGTDRPETKNIIGRTGENEFVIYADFAEYDLFKATDRIKESLEELSERFSGVYIQEPGDVQIRVGASVYPIFSTDYDELYDQAKEVLEKSIDSSGQIWALYSNKEGKGGHR